MATLPQGVGLDTSINYVTRPTNTYIIDHESNQIAGMDDGIAAMRQAVEIILNTERYRWQVYDSNFGVELDDLPGEEYDYIQSDLPRRIEEAFSVDSRILSVENYSFTNPESGKMTVTFDVVTVYGVMAEEVVIGA